jgi:exosome complex exonuclease RRP6
LYLVNLFDTFHASKVLDFPRHGLAQLLEMYCDVIPDKRYQTADWRLRPLPAEMLKYARMDTHYLLFIYDQLRNALLDRAKSPSSEGLDVSPMREVLSRSAITAKRTHTREPYDPAGGGVGGWDVMAKKWNKTNLLASAVHAPGSVGNMQRAVFQAIHAWRDRTARQEDESTRFVLPNHYMFQIAEQPPADMAALMSVFHPVPHVIRVRAKEFLDTIRGAVKQALGPAPSEDAPAQHGATSPHSEDVLSDAMDLNEEGGLDSFSSNVLLIHVDADPPAAAEATETKTAMPPSVNTASSARFLAPTSTLLGDVLGTQRHGPRHAKPAFENVLAKINSSLSIVPSAPMVSTIGLVAHI